MELDKDKSEEQYKLTKEDLGPQLTFVRKTHLSLTKTKRHTEYMKSYPASDLGLSTNCKYSLSVIEWTKNLHESSPISLVAFAMLHKTDLKSVKSITTSKNW